MLFGLACLAGTVCHEVKWRRMFANWEATSGVITAEIDGDETSSPEIEFIYNGTPKRFVSKYGGGEVRIGKSVNLLFNPNNGDAEELKWSNRWLPNLAMSGFGALGLFVGFFAG